LKNGPTKKLQRLWGGGMCEIWVGGAEKHDTTVEGGERGKTWEKQEKRQRDGTKVKKRKGAVRF